MGNINTDLAYNYIRSRILNGELPPGHPLIANSLSVEIGVSRTPVREALLQLEADGLVTIRARLGASVKILDVKEFRELCGLRKALEGYAAGLAAQERTEGDLHEIGFALETVRQQTEKEIATAPDQLPIDAGVREDVQFHLTIVNAAKSDLLKREIVRLHLLNGVMCTRIALTSKGPSLAADHANFIALSRRVHAEHEEIYDAIKHGDATTAENTMKRHVQNMIDRNLRIMMRTESRLIASELATGRPN